VEPEWRLAVDADEIVVLVGGPPDAPEEEARRALDLRVRALAVLAGWADGRGTVALGLRQLRALAARSWGSRSMPPSSRSSSCSGAGRCGPGAWSVPPTATGP
jgi:hypothetical protein